MTKQDFEAKLVGILRENKISYSADYGESYSDYIVKITDELRLKIGVGDIAVSISTFMGKNHVSFMDVFYEETSDVRCSDKTLFIDIEGKATFMTVALA